MYLQDLEVLCPTLFLTVTVFDPGGRWVRCTHPFFLQLENVESMVMLYVLGAVWLYGSQGE